jgi:hypothetical protein
VRSITTDDAVPVSGWRYPDRWSAYDLRSSTDISDELDLYWAVTDGDDNLIGFSCVESAACVRGLNPDPEILGMWALGWILALVGQGSSQVFGKAAHDHLGRRYPGRPCAR